MMYEYAVAFVVGIDLSNVWSKPSKRPLRNDGAPQTDRIFALVQWAGNDFQRIGGSIRDCRQDRKHRRVDGQHTNARDGSVCTSDPALIGHRPLRQSLDQDHPPLAPSARTGRRPRQRILGLASYYRKRSLSRHDPARRQAVLVLGINVELLDCHPDRRLGIGGLDLAEIDRLFRDTADLPDGSNGFWLRRATRHNTTPHTTHTSTPGLESGGAGSGVKAVAEPTREMRLKI